MLRIRIVFLSALLVGPMIAMPVSASGHELLNIVPSNIVEPFCTETTMRAKSITLAGCLERCKSLGCSAGAYNRNEDGVQCIFRYDPYVKPGYEPIARGEANEENTREACTVPIASSIDQLSIAQEHELAEVIHDCTWGNDNLAHCLSDFCLPVGDSEECYFDVPACFDKYGREVICP